MSNQVNTLKSAHTSYLDDWDNQIVFFDTKNKCEYTVRDISGMPASIDPEEVNVYIMQLNAKLAPGKLKRLSIIVDGEFVDFGYEFVMPGITFERIRRITGYLVGTLDRFNDAKRSEVEDRLKHSYGYEDSEIARF